MKNYNPINANTLGFECLGLEEFQTLRSFCINNASSIFATDAIIGDSNYNFTVRLLTNYSHLEKFWKLNFKSSESNSTLIEGEIIFLENHNNDVFLKRYDFEKYRYYNKELNSIISLGNDFYGNVKISYRAICANVAIKSDILTLHSGCLRIQDKNIALTGDSGAGKSTLFDLLDKYFASILIWEDFGFINSTNSQIIVPNEIFIQLNHRTIKSMFPSFEKTSEVFYSEFFEEGNPFYNERRLMVDLSEYRKTIQNTPINFPTVLDALIIITNDINLPFNIKRVSADEAIKIFAKLNFSKAHQANIRYANGSLILTEEQNEIYHQSFLTLFKVIKNLIVLNNIYTPINPNEIVDFINEN